MINKEVILVGCRAYVGAVEPGVSPDVQAAHAASLANGETVPGMLTMPGPLLAALAAAVDADRHDWDAVTRQYH